MKNPHFRQATLFLATLALLTPACTPVAPAAEESAHPYGHDYLPETQERHEYWEKLLADIQHAARECSGMEWYATLEGFGPDAKPPHKSYPVSPEDAAIIRNLLLHKLHTVKYGFPNMDVDPAWPIRSKRLRFLDAWGKVIYEFEFDTVFVHIGKDSNTDANGYQCFSGLSLPDAAYETWIHLIPAKMDEDLDKWVQEARK